ncbi:hypothetical protein KEM55_005137, partial [Ascosphaera atra]
DFSGQAKADSLSTSLLSISAAISLLLGFLSQDIFITLWTFVASFLLCCLLVVPAWPCYTRDPVQWLLPGGVSRKELTSDE